MESFLTTAEEKVMQLLWSLEEAVIRDLVDGYDPPKPAYTTVATIIKILEKKGYVGHREVGNTYLYYPLISRERYRGKVLRNLMKDYFSDSFTSLLSHFSQPGELTTKEMEELIAHLQQQVETKRKDTGDD